MLKILDEKIPDSWTCQKTNSNAKITKIEDKTTSITELANTTTINAVEHKIPKVSDLVNV